MNRLLTISSLLIVLLVGQARSIEESYSIPFWTEQQGTGGGYTDGPYGSTWYIGRTNQAGSLFIGPSSRNSGPVYNQTDNEWQYINQTLLPSGKTIESGNARYKSSIELTTDGIWNQFPRPVLIFETRLKSGPTCE